MLMPKTSKSQKAPIKKVTVHLPAELVEKALKASGKSLTETVEDGLQKVVTAWAYAELLKLRGKVKFSESWQSLKDDRE